MVKNKVKYGLCNVHYAVGHFADDGSATYDAPKPWRGAVNLSLDAQGDTTKFRADNIDYWVGQANNGYEGDFESALIPDDFRIDVLGDFVDNNGNLVEDAGSTGNPFALLFQFEGDVHATRHVLYNCTASRPSVSGATTESTIEPQTESVNMTASSVYVPALDKNIVKARCNKTDANYDTFFDAVVLPTSAAVMYTVTFDSDGGTPVASQTVPQGGKATEPTAPTKSGFQFDGWTIGGSAYDFNTTVSGDITLVATWTPSI